MAEYARFPTNLKTNVKGFEEGDRNTRYFHSMIREKKKKASANQDQNS